MENMTLWQISWAIGVVVVLIVAVLLLVIIAAARSIDKRANEIWIAGKQIAANTVSIWMLQKTNAVAGDILNNWADEVMPLLSSAYQDIEVRWVDLETEEGSAGSRSSTTAHTWPEEGGTAGAPLPNNVTGRITKVAEGRRRNQRNGRMALGGMVESYTEAGQGNRLTPTAITNLQDALEAFKDGVNGTEPISGRVTNLVVVHTLNGVYESSSQISVFRVEPIVGTLRRRMPGYGD